MPRDRSRSDAAYKTAMDWNETERARLAGELEPPASRIDQQMTAVMVFLILMLVVILRLAFLYVELGARIKVIENETDPAQTEHGAIPTTTLEEGTE